MVTNLFGVGSSCFLSC